MRAALSALEPSERAALSVRVTARLSALPIFSGASSVALYASLPDEVATKALLVARWSRGEPVWLPRMRADGALDFVAVRGENGLHSVRYGIREPLPELPATSPTDLDVLVLPGLAFDRGGVRLGRGGGFYDRSFADLDASAPRPRAIGIAFSFQLVEELPRLDHDLAVDLLVTEHGVENPR